jgi:hypothetical protein
MGRPQWRDLPPVEPIEPPGRFSMTLLKHADACLRSAYLYLKHGSAPSPELDRGSAYHLFAEQVPWTLLQSAQMDREGAAEGSIEPAAAVLEADVAETMMNAILEEHPELAVTSRDADALRIMAYHAAGDERGRAGQRKPDGRPYPVGFDWAVGSLVAVERMWVLEIDGIRVVCKIDMAWLGADMVLRVRDHKTTLAIPTQDKFEGTFQLKLYGAAMLFGRPLNEETGELEPGIGGGVNWVDVGEVYPRYLLSTDGTMQQRTAVFSRAELQKFLDVDAVRVVRKLKGALESWKFDASRGSHCSICPAAAECPLPKVLRPHSGEINTLEQAEEALTWAEVTSARVNATRAEAKIFARAHGMIAVPCGTDEEYQWVASESWTTRWDALEEKVERARLFGEPFAMAEVRRRSSSTSFKKVKVTAASS